MTPIFRIMTPRMSCKKWVWKINNVYYLIEIFFLLGEIFFYSVLHDKYYSTSIKCLFQFAAGVPLRTLRLRGLPRPLLRVPVWPLQLLSTSHDREHHERTNNQKLPNGTEVLKRRSQCWTSCSKSWKCVFFHELFSSDFSVCRYWIPAGYLHCVVPGFSIVIASRQSSVVVYGHQGPHWGHSDTALIKNTAGYHRPGRQDTCPGISALLLYWKHNRGWVEESTINTSENISILPSHYPHIVLHPTPRPLPTHLPPLQSPSPLSIKPDGEISIAYYF